MIFDSRVEVLGDFPDFPLEVVREEHSQARVPIAQARDAGPAHRAFLETLPPEWQADPTVEIFSRLLYLKPGWYPLGPHYHLDWHQPDGRLVETRMVLLGGASRTEFLHGRLELPDDAPRGAWAEAVATAVREGRLERYYLAPRHLIRFDNRVWHRARPADTAGWRLLMRAIRGLPDSERHAPGRFTTARNGYLPESPEESARYAPYRD